MHRTRRLALLAGLSLITAWTATFAQTPAEPPTITWDQAGEYVDQEVIVTGQVVRVGGSQAGNVYLNFDKNWQKTLSIFIPKASAGQLGGEPKALYEGKTIRVRGKIYLYKGAPNLKGTDAGQISLADGSPAPAAAATPAVGSADPSAAPPAEPTATDSDATAQPDAPTSAAPAKPGDLTIAWSDAADFVGHRVSVIGKVVRTHRTAKGTVFLNFKQDYRGTLTLYVSERDAGNFPAPPETAYKDKMVKARGQITLHQGSPSLTLKGASDIEVLPDDTALPAKPAVPPLPKAGQSIIAPDEYLPTVPWNKVNDFLGDEVFVVGKIVKTSRAPGRGGWIRFSEDSNTLELFIRAKYLDNFPGSLADYEGKNVRVRGDLYTFKDHPSLSLNNPSQVDVLPDDYAIPAEPIVPLKLAPTMTKVPGETITIASFNLLNLFDSQDDPYRADDALDGKPRAEMEALARTIRALDADVIAVVEVENRDFLQIFCKVFLGDLGYEPVLFEGNDGRGIDVGVLSRLPVGRVVSHRHERFPDETGRITRFRRDLLQVRIEPQGGTPFDVFVVHFKSKGGQENGGIETRLGEAKHARVLLDEILAADPKAQFVICGDYNDTLDSPPVQALIGSGATGLRNFVDDLPANQRISYNEEPFRSLIDFILASPAMAGRYVKGSYAIPQGTVQTFGSDHNPVQAKFRTR